MAGDAGPSDADSRRQGFGCLALALFSLLGAALFVFLGCRCLLTRGIFDCIGLLTIFPAAFVAIGLISGAIGLQRFTAAGRPQRSTAALAGLETGWQSLGSPGSNGKRRFAEPPDVINLPPRRHKPDGRNDREAEDEDV
jgi:hypothetical protein